MSVEQYPDAVMPECPAYDRRLWRGINQNPASSCYRDLCGPFCSVRRDPDVEESSQPPEAPCRYIQSHSFQSGPPGSSSQIYSEPARFFKEESDLGDQAELGGISKCGS